MVKNNTHYEYGKKHYTLIGEAQLRCNEREPKKFDTWNYIANFLQEAPKYYDNTKYDLKHDLVQYTWVTVGYPNKLALDNIPNAKKKVQDHVKQNTSKCKLLINSHIKYSTALQKLFQSLKDINFNHFDNTIVVIGGCKNYEGPKYETIYGVKCVVIRTSINNFDYNAFIEVSKICTHPLLKAHNYFFLQDTCTVNKQFNAYFENMDIKPNEIIAYKLPSSNVCCFDYLVMQKLKDNNLHFCTRKNHTVILEYKSGHLDQDDGSSPYVEALWKYGNLKIIGERTQGAPIDIYNLGIKRTPFYYLKFGVIKYILLHRYGDFNKKVKNIIRQKASHIKCKNLV